MQFLRGAGICRESMMMFRSTRLARAEDKSLPFALTWLYDVSPVQDCIKACRDQVCTTYEQCTYQIGQKEDYGGFLF